MVNGDTFLERINILSRKVTGYFIYAAKLDLGKFVGSNVTMSALGPCYPALICRRTGRITAAAGCSRIARINCRAAG